MPNAKKPRSTGPKTAKGKSKSSLNAVSHGLTSARVLPDEVQLAREFTLELTQHYRPSSPLQVLQIQRIAFCRAKLAKLIDIEIAGREIQRRRIEAQPDLVMAELNQYPGDLKSLALQEIRGQSILGKFALDEKTLNAIAREVDGLFAPIDREDDLPKRLPKLCEFLTRAKQIPEQADEVGLDQRLMIFAQKIRNLESSEKANSTGTPSIDELMVKIDREQQLSNLAARKISRTGSGQAGDYQRSVDADLVTIRGFFEKFNQIDAVKSAFEEMKSWMLRSIDLNAQEADRMMKYQTMLERRLSTAIGELLQLQDQNK